MKKLFGLGRGLQSLIPTSPTKNKASVKGDNIYNVEVGRIKPNASQPRKDFDEAALKELAASIKKYGILQPLLVLKRETETDKGIDVEYELIAGERRLRAAKLAGLPQVPVIIKDDFDENRVKLEVALVENLQREDLNPIDEALAYKKLQEDFKLTHQEIANRVGRSREAVTNSCRLLNLPENIQEAVRAGKIMRTQARSLLIIKEPERRQELFKQYLEGRLVVRDVEASGQNLYGTRKPSPNSVFNLKYNELQDNLTKTLNAPVFIKARDEGGRIEIRFASLEELNAIAKTILD